ncbi:MAG: pyrroline-5-carboxylate reductase [Dehalococcoidia bacterium]|nr:pyrroline-5-carboxylate reductase [Dehalococcoidia bacterium]
MKLACIGGGVMAEAILAGVLRQRVAAPGDIVVGEVLAARREQLHKQLRVKATADNAAAVAGAQVVVLAVKPQHLAEVLAGLRGKLKPSQLVLSIVAGATVRTITTGLGHNRIVRAMPNTPGQIGAGITAWTATPQVTIAQKEAAAGILAALGEQIAVADEKMIDIATALSGSGPAYVFLFIEALTEAGVYLGMSRDHALKLALHTVAGSGRMALETGIAPATLRERVTSPGGTTAEALLVLEEEGFRSAIINAAAAAYDKARALGGEKNA